MGNRIEFMNGTGHKQDNVKVKPKTSKPRPTKAEAAQVQRAKQVRQYAAGFAGGVGVGMLGLSVYHCTEAIQALAPSHIALSALLAIGIDAGMVASEVAELVTTDTHAQRWARLYMLISVAMSMLLNGYANWTHASTLATGVFGVALGVAVPCLVFVLGKVAGHLAKAKG